MTGFVRSVNNPKNAVLTANCFPDIIFKRLDAIDNYENEEFFYEKCVVKYVF